MKKTYLFLSALVVLTLSCLLTSCESKFENLIVGEWKLSNGLNMWDGDLDVLFERWIFEEDGYFQILDSVVLIHEPVIFVVGEGGMVGRKRI